MQYTHRAAVSEYAWASVSWWMTLLGAAQTLITQTIASFGGLLELYSSLLLGAWEDDAGYSCMANPKDRFSTKS
jgi:uncharacterized membrane protein